MKSGFSTSSGGLRLALLAGLLALATAGCTRSLQVGTGSNERPTPTSAAFVLPPPGGPALVGVTERSYANGIQQDIALATRSAIPGQNSLRVRLYGPVKTPIEPQTRLPEEFLPLNNISSDIRRAVPGFPLQRAQFYVQNRYGPFGYAVGRRGRETCLYGFQNIRAREFTWNDRGSIDIRLRLCETDASEAQLLAVMYGYTVNVFVDANGWNPYGPAAAVPDSLGRPGPDIYPTAMGQTETVLPPAPPAPVVVPVQTRARRVSAPAPQPAPLPAPIGPTVPPPPGAAPATTAASPDVAPAFPAVPPPPSSR